MKQYNGPKERAHGTTGNGLRVNGFIIQRIIINSSGTGKKSKYQGKE